MRIELIQIAALFAADVALPGVALAVAAFVQKVQSLVWEGDPTVGTLQPAAALLRPSRRRRFAARVLTTGRRAVV